MVCSVVVSTCKCLDWARDNTSIVIARPRYRAIQHEPPLHSLHARTQSPVIAWHTKAKHPGSLGPCRIPLPQPETPTVSMDPDPPLAIAPSSPPIWRWVISFLAVGACWGLTTPFMRRAAVIRDQQPKQQRPYLTSDAPWLKRKIWGILYAVMDLLRNPAYAVPLLLNVTGSVSSLEAHT
jgi:hypothetical protein